MTKRKPVSAQQNIWFDTEQVDDTDLSLEQDYNNTITSGIINNHIGTGVLAEALEENVIFDSESFVGYLDGVAVYAQNQPTDNNFGNQLEIELAGSIAASRKAVKVAIIGLDFQDNLQFETFYFKTNESQITRKHYASILLLLFNDFIGDPSYSMNLGGRLVIKEAKPMSLSRDPIMVSQDVEPNLFFRDFFITSPTSLHNFLQAALPTYNIDSLGIYTSELENKFLLNGDVTTQIGEKFLATTNNIQKITLLLSVRNLVVGSEDDLTWNGDLVVSVYPLQSDVDCPSDIAPSLPIDFSPSNIPLAQISDGYASLSGRGVVLDSVPQPVDFIFSNSPIAGGNVLEPGKYYAFSVKRSGAANKCDIMIAVGSDHTDNSRITTFTGNLWVDIPEQDLWFRIWNDAAKVSDGQAYDTGIGVVIEKTTVDPESQATVDQTFGALQFAGNDVFRAMVSASTNESTPVPDQSTGNPVNSRKQYIPDIILLNTIDITNLDAATEPLLLGAITDKNKKFYDQFSSTINSNLHSATLVDDELLIRVFDDPTDGYRFDGYVNDLVANLLNGDFVGAKISRVGAPVDVYYRIADAKLCSMILGDVNGDGLIDIEDLDLLNTYLGFNLNFGLPLNTTVTPVDGYHTLFQNGYTSETKSFSNLFSASFQLIDPTDGYVVASGTDGVLVANPSDPTLAQFTSASVNFNVIVGLVNYKLLINAPLTPENYGGFDIVSPDSVTDVLTIRKIILSGDVLGQILRSDIDGDGYIGYEDGYLLESYIDKVPSIDSFTTTYPAPATNPYTKIGTRFNVIRLKLEKYVDRTDDYTTLTVGRGPAIHESPDIFKEDVTGLTYFYAGHDFLNSPVPIRIDKQLTWDESLIVTNSQPKLVPTVFTDSTSPEVSSCVIDGIQCNVYGSLPDFEKGKVDVFAPDNIILGDGEIKRPDGNFYKVDFEVGTIVLEIPDGLFGSERTINIMDDFIADYTGNGVTRLGFPSMRFADCSYVLADALSKDQVRFSVAVQSFSPNNDGYSDDGYYGAIVDGKMGVSVDYSTGLITINFSNLYQDQVLRTLSTKIQITVYLKKGSFNNKPLFVDSTKVQNMLQLISVFSGANVGGPSALVDLGTDVTSVLPLVHGGTGLNTVGATGTVLMSDGSGVSYAFVTDGLYFPLTPGNWAGTPTSLSIQDALDRLAAAVFGLLGSPIP